MCCGKAIRVSESLVLSSIFIGIIALIGFIGASFGIARGFVATAAILLGSELALWWGDNLGSRLSDLTGIGSATGHFLSGMFFLLITVLLLGVSGSVVLAWGTPARWGALLGALLGAANGALLIAMALRLYDLAYAGRLTSVPLDDSVVTRVLWLNFDWFLLGFAVIGSVLLLYTRFAHLVITTPDPVVREPFFRPIPPPVSKRPSGLPPADFAAAASETPLAPNGAAAASSPETIDDTVYAPPRRTAAASGASRDRPVAAPAREPDTEVEQARLTVRFCPNCGMTLDPSDHFCPDCGFTL